MRVFIVRCERLGTTGLRTMLDVALSLVDRAHLPPDTVPDAALV